MPSSFAIGQHFENFIDRLVESGRYNSRSEVVREGLRTLEDREEKRRIASEKLNALLEEGINSGPPIPAEEVFEELRARIKKIEADQAQ